MMIGPCWLNSSKFSGGNIQRACGCAKRDQYRQGNDLARVGHALKGSLANLSAIGASDLASRLEVIGQAADMSGAQSVLDALVSELDHVTRALEALCPVGAQ